MDDGFICMDIDECENGGFVLGCVIIFLVFLSVFVGLIWFLFVILVLIVILVRWMVVIVVLVSFCLV